MEYIILINKFELQFDFLHMIFPYTDNLMIEWERLI